MSEKEKKGGGAGAQVAPAMGPPGLIAKEDIPAVLPILPLRNSVFFPGGVLPLAVGRQKTIALIKDAVRDEQVIGVVTQRRAEEEDPGAADLYTMGTVARVVKLLKMGEDNYSLVVQGLARFRVLELVQEAPYLKARIDAGRGQGRRRDDVEVEALGINLKKLAREVIELMPELPAAATELVESITHPGHLADLIAANVDVPIEEKQPVLETVDLKARMKLVLELLNRKREILKLSNKIDSAVKGEMSKTQREYYLRQQLKAIKEELGEMGEEEEELDELAERLKKAGLPPEVEKVAQKELNRLKTIPAASSEYTVARTYLDWIADLPWTKQTEDNLDIENARQILDARPLRPREGQEAHPRVPGRPQAQERHAAAPSSASWARPASARPRSASPSPGPWAASSCACRWAACATRRRSAATGAPTSAPCPAASSRR